MTTTPEASAASGLPPAEDSTTAVSIVIATAPDAGAAAEIARALVVHQLAACVNIVPTIRSIYRWEGQVCDEQEVLLIAKAPSRSVPRLIDAIKARHPYQTPEILAFAVESGFPPYLRWVIDAVRE